MMMLLMRSFCFFFSLFTVSSDDDSVCICVCVQTTHFYCMGNEADI